MVLDSKPPKFKFSGGFRGRGGRGSRGRGGWEDRGGRGGGRGFGAFGEWDQGNGDQMNGQASGEGFGNWNNDAKDKEPKKDREQRQRERKSRWGDAEPEGPAEATETSIPELETCAPSTVTDNTDMDIEAEAPESEASVPAGITEGQPQEIVPTEQLFQPPIHETSASEEQIFQTPVQEDAAPDVQENYHADPSESMPFNRNSDIEDVMENQIPAPETLDDISESINPPSER